MASLTHFFLFPGSYGCDDLIFPNIFFSGTVISSLKAFDVAVCQQACNQNSECQFFTYSLHQSSWCMCYLKQSDSGLPDNVTSVISQYSGFNNQSSEKGLLGCADLLVSDLEYEGISVLEEEVQSSQECQQLCTNHALCQFFTVLPTDTGNGKSICYLKNAPGNIPTMVTARPTALSGFSMDYNSMKKAAARRALREHLGEERGDGGNPSSIISLLNATSGFSESLSGLQRECITEMYDGVDFPGSDERSLNAKSFEECRSLCTADPICQFFTFFNQTFLTPDQTNTCYLKSLLLVPLPEIIRHSPGVVSGYPQRNCNGKIPDYPDYVLPSC
ncbi:coagulation factor XI-like [Pelobates cultripes]|uniref:Coagulation factor XI-like n=1 Tax=Pelobates cultripes TaxID=61616 RepID=A0AAD1SCU7_PELCU|nr:coagulation factor XI-like [Pelobates cultripes]